MRPGTSAQAALAQAAFSGDQPRHFQFGFIAASDVHSARPGTGYKEQDRARTVDFVGGRRRGGGIQSNGPIESLAPEQVQASVYTVFNSERNASMLYTGGLAAVHSQGRSREQVWDALKRREVYGTSGPRILLWFDHLDSDGQKTPMGQQVSAGDNPRFSVRALGSFQQKPGCPQDSIDALGDRLQRLCGGECYHPADTRLDLAAIEVIKILPQQSADERLEDLIIDPWRRFDCNGPSCEISFSDEAFLEDGRPATYYVRALQVATPTINGAGLDCELDDSGQCVAVTFCHGDDRTPRAEDCLAPVQHRAWSSPIYVQHQVGLN